jgi:hypothetical protein
VCIRNVLEHCVVAETKCNWYSSILIYSLYRKDGVVVYTTWLGVKIYICASPVLGSLRVLLRYTQDALLTL